MRITIVSPPANMSGGIKSIAIYAQALETVRTHCLRRIATRHRHFDHSETEVMAEGEQLATRSDDGTGRIWMEVILTIAYSIAGARSPMRTFQMGMSSSPLGEKGRMGRSIKCPQRGKGLFIQHHEIIDLCLPVPRSQATYRCHSTRS